MQNVYTTDEGRTVLHPRPGIDQAGDLCKNIYENLMHTDLGYFDAGLGDNGTWHVKPVMKIPSNTPDDALVLEIYILNFAGNVIKQVNLRGMNFKVGGSYSGNYTSDYVFLGLNDSLQVSGSTNGGLSEGWHEAWYWDCAVDFQVYWPGNVEVWFDKMVVDDDVGNGLFDGMYDYRILDETTPENFLLTALMVKKEQFAESNYKSVNYVMNVMYNKLMYQAQPISLK